MIVDILLHPTHSLAQFNIRFQFFSTFFCHLPILRCAHGSVPIVFSLSAVCVLGVC